MIFALQPVLALVDPLAAVPRAVRSRQWGWPLVLLMISVSFSGASFALRWDPAAHVLRQLAEQGELERTTEQELTQAIITAARIELVAGMAKGILAVPLLVLGLAVVLKLTAWFLSRRIAFDEALTAAAVGLIPIAVCHLVFGAVALASEGVSLVQREALVPRHLGHVLTGLGPGIARLASVADVFNLWAATLVGLGFSRATGLPRWRALLVALTVYVAIAAVFLVGFPVMWGGPR